MNTPQDRESMLAFWLGELMYERDNCHDWIRENALTDKINAIYVLLGIDKNDETAFSQLLKLATNPHSPK
jgi:hypothetical protein